MNAQSCIAATVASLVLSGLSCAAVPTGERGDAADALARRIQANVKHDRWEQTGAVAFDFRGMRAHLWDRTRGMHHLQSGDLEVWLDLWDRGGVATRGGEPLAGDELAAALAKAWSTFCNDTYWLNPLAKLFDDGVVRELVTVDGKAALKVAFGSGGVTPGDSYVWIVDDAGAVRAGRFWVQQAPLSAMPGAEFRFSGWIALATGARIATLHEASLPGAVVELKDVRGAATLAELVPGPDPFSPLVKRRGG